MTPEQFRAWRKSLSLKQKDAAELLGVKKRIVQYYETGERDGKSVEIPKYVRLSCYAISQGILDFDGDGTVVAAPTDAKSKRTDRAADASAEPKTKGKAKGKSAKSAGPPTGRVA
jgi:transcriptional regulator with XRE-family HTH domain